jgi:hypothetical protein
MFEPWRVPFVTPAIALALAAQPATLAGQQPRNDVVRVFLDCQTRGCDFDHFRRQITFADWVRDRADAQVQVLVTSQPTGGGGRSYDLSFIGLAEYEGRRDTLTYASRSTDTDAEVRDGLTRVLTLGLVSFAAHTGAADGLQVTFVPRAPGEQAAPIADPWNFWVFRIRAGGFLRGESRQRNRNFNGGLSASRVTRAMKLQFGASARYGHSEYETDSVTTVVSTQTSWSTSALGVWSLSNHWSVGGRVNVSGATYVNQDLAVRLGPVLEYNVFPYTESTHRLLTVQFALRGVYYRYIDVTIFGKTAEAHPAHSVEISFSQNQSWGNLHSSLEWFQYWHDLHRHLLQVYGGLDVRLVRGLSLDLNGNFARVKDQLYLSSVGLTAEEILLSQRALGTDYRYNLSFGLSYRFGSVFNNVVNPRIR